MKGFKKYWGYVVLAILLSAWWISSVGPAFLIVLSAAATFYFLFQAPVFCGAANRNEKPCRNNASGLLLGCQLQQHKWQKLKLLVVPAAWRRLNRGLWVNPTTGLNTVLAGLTILSTISALIKPLFG